MEFVKLFSHVSVLHASGRLTYRVLAVTDQQREELRRIVAEQTALHLASKEKARAFLIKTGTLTPEGILAPEFDSPEKPKTH